MHSFIEYVRRNIMFVVILTAIILVTAGLVIYQMVLAAPTQGDTQEPAEIRLRAWSRAAARRPSSVSAGACRAMM